MNTTCVCTHVCFCVVSLDLSLDSHIVIIFLVEGGAGLPARTPKKWDDSTLIYN